MSESPCITYMALYILTFHILQTNSRTSTFWKLNVEDGKITEVNHFPSIVTSTLPNDNGDDPIFNIITSTVHFGKSWTKKSAENYCTDCQSANSSHRQTQPTSINTQAYNTLEGFITTFRHRPIMLSQLLQSLIFTKTIGHQAMAQYLL